MAQYVNTCPVCGHNDAARLGQVEDRDAFAYDCPRCGRYKIDGLVLAMPPLREKSANERGLLTIALRAASDAGHPVFVDVNSFDHLIDSALRNRSLFEAVDRTLLLLAGRVDRFRSPAPFDKSVDYPLVYARSEEEMNDYLAAAGELGFFDIYKSTITLDGWRRVEALRATSPQSRQAFVAMWFAKELDDAWLNGFKKGIEETEYYHAIRVDSVEHNEKIDDRIFAEIRRSGLVVADFTGDRGGVYYEAGYAMGLGIPVIWTCRVDYVNKLHFDTRQYNHIVWESVSQLKDRLRDRIAATVMPHASGAA
jgi:hypothetical protein